MLQVQYAYSRKNVSKTVSLKAVTFLILSHSHALFLLSNRPDTERATMQLTVRENWGQILFVVFH